MQQGTSEQQTISSVEQRLSTLLQRCSRILQDSRQEATLQTIAARTQAPTTQEFRGFRCASVIQGRQLVKSGIVMLRRKQRNVRCRLSLFGDLLLIAQIKVFLKDNV